MTEQTVVQARTPTRPATTPAAKDVLQRQCACGQHTAAGGECEECKKKREATVQRAAISPAPVHEVPPIVHEVLSSPGQPLDTATRSFMEPRFGHDFSRVRMHIGTRAAESARAVNALAYTVGHDMVFGAGQYAPQTGAGQSLLAHELTHVVQQSSRTSEAVPAHELTLASEAQPTEREAALAEQAISSDRSHNPTTTGVIEIAREDAGTAQSSSGGSTETTPSFLQRTIQDFCQPFASRHEARAARQYAVQNLLPLIRAAFGSEVGSIWQTYLNRRHGDSLARQVFSSPSSEIVQGFSQSATTRDRQRQLADLIAARIPSQCPALPPGVVVDIPVSTYLTREELEYPINFNQKYERPGNIAGGVSSSDAGPDSRQVSGHVSLLRSVDGAGRTTNVRLQTHFDFLIQDAVDFCPGGTGASDEQSFTILLSRLEMTGLFLQDEPFAYDVPFQVRYSGPLIDEDLDHALVRRCFPDATGGAQSPPSPTPEQPTEGPGTRREDR